MTPDRGFPPRFLCDEMLHRLARWLRAAGYDTALARDGDPDGAVLADALAEHRWMVTRDRGLLSHRDAAKAVVLIDGDHLAEQAEALSRQVPIDWQLAPMTRCLVCNRPLRPATETERLATPAAVRGSGVTVLICDTCAKAFWPGGHERRIQRTLADFAARFGASFGARR